uniref:hypothetical protein n=1 Tax=Bifidobacterium adolescentis TaxID=1680 RepID=UPI0040266D27
MSRGFIRGDDRVPIYRMRDFDDAIMESPRIRRALHGRTREAALVRYDEGYGDFETCCRAVAMLCELWREGTNPWFDQAVLMVVQTAGSLSRWDGLQSALSRTFDVEYLDGTVDPANLIAWCAVCAVKGGTSFDCCALFDDVRAQRLIIAVFKSFDRLDMTCYNDKELSRIFNQGR